MTHRYLAGEFENIISESQFLQEVLDVALSTNLQNWWIVGGCVRDIVWSSITKQNIRYDIIRDIDLVHFDPNKTNKDVDRYIQSELPRVRGIGWSVKNQARMHLVNHESGYESIEDAVFKFPETVASIAISKTRGNNLTFFTCYGFEDLFGMIFRPTVHYRKTRTAAEFVARVDKKHWLQKWPDSLVVQDD